jgi:uroporphyrinogen-III synthase
MKTILLTRNDSENDILNEKLSSYNFNCIKFSLVEFEEIIFDYSLLKNYLGVIVTSKYVAKIIAKSTQYFDNASLKFWVVGKISAAIIEKANLKVEYIAKNVIDLIHNFPGKLYKDTIYLSGNKITKNLPSDIKRYIIYNVKYKDEMTLSDKEIISRGVDYVLLYSLNCAKTFTNLMCSQNMIKTFENTTFIAISLKVAKQILLYFDKVLYCEEGEQTKMIELLITHAKN